MIRPTQSSYEHDELAHAIIGAVLEVHSEFGVGLMEKIYENALCCELSIRGLR